MQTLVPAASVLQLTARGVAPPGWPGPILMTVPEVGQLMSMDNNGAAERPMPSRSLEQPSPARTNTPSSVLIGDLPGRVRRGRRVRRTGGNRVGVYTGAVRLLAALLLVGSVAHAADEDIAKAHFNLGLSYYDSGRFEPAAKEFLEAYRLAPRPGMLYNLART